MKVGAVSVSVPAVVDVVAVSSEFPPASAAAGAGAGEAVTAAAAASAALSGLSLGSVAAPVAEDGTF